MEVKSVGVQNNEDIIKDMVEKRIGKEIDESTFTPDLTYILESVDESTK